MPHGQQVSQRVRVYLRLYLRDSSSEKYESVWRKFRKFISSKNFEEIGFEAIAQFCVILFEQLSLIVPAIESYLAALKQPRSLDFGIDFENIKFIHLI